MEMGRNGHFVDLQCPNCGHSPIYKEAPEDGAPTEYYCHFCNKGIKFLDMIRLIDNVLKKDE